MSFTVQQQIVSDYWYMPREHQPLEPEFSHAPLPDEFGDVTKMPPPEGELPEVPPVDRPDLSQWPGTPEDGWFGESDTVF